MTAMTQLLRNLSSATSALRAWRLRCAGAWLRLRPSGEDGFAIVTVLLVLVVGLGLGAVAVAESLDSHDLANQDQHQRLAQQATDAGIQSQLYQQGEQSIMSTLSLGGGPLNLSTILDCLVPQTSVSGQLTGTLLSASVFSSTAGVCPGSSTGGVNTGTIPTQALGQHTYDQAEFIPGASSLNGGTLYPKIVSLGWNDNGGSGRTVYSRQQAILAPIAPLRTLEAQGNLSISGLSVLGLGVSTVYGNVSANNNLTTPTGLVLANLDNIVANGILGTASYGGTYSGFLTVPPPTKVTQPVVRQPISVSTTKNSCPDVGNTCAYTAGVSGISTGYSASTDTFSLSSGNATFAPGDYVLCSFNATGGTVTASPISTTPVRIFIDSPTSARCNSTTTTASLNQYNDKADANRGNFIAKNGVANGGVLSLGGIVASSGLQVYVVGDQNKANPYDNATTVQIGSDCTLLICANQLTQSMIVYAPTSTVSLYTGTCVLLQTLCTGGVFAGALIGDNVTAEAVTFSENLAIGNYPLYNGVEVYHPIQFGQCTSQPYQTVAGVTTTYTRLQGDKTIDTNGC